MIMYSTLFLQQPDSKCFYEASIDTTGKNMDSGTEITAFQIAKNLPPVILSHEKVDITPDLKKYFSYSVLFEIKSVQNYPYPDFLLEPLENLLWEKIKHDLGTEKLGTKKYFNEHNIERIRQDMYREAEFELSSAQNIEKLLLFSNQKKSEYLKPKDLQVKTFKNRNDDHDKQQYYENLCVYFDKFLPFIIRKRIPTKEDFIQFKKYWVKTLSVEIMDCFDEFNDHVDDNQTVTEVTTYANNKQICIILGSEMFCQSIPPNSSIHWIFEALLDGSLILCLTTEILREYETMFNQRFSEDIAKIMLKILDYLPKIEKRNHHTTQPISLWELKIELLLRS